VHGGVKKGNRAFSMSSGKIDRKGKKEKKEKENKEQEPSSEKGATAAAHTEFRNPVEKYDRAIVLTAYLNCLRNLVNGFSSTVIKEPEISSMMNNELIQAATQCKFISLVHGHGKGTFFCNLPEKEVLITGNEALYRIFSGLYRAETLLVNSTGFRVLVPGFHHTRLFIDYDIFNPDLPGSREVEGRYNGILPLNEACGHKLEIVSGVEKYVELIRIFFNPAEGHPQHRLSASSWKMPICVNAKSFDIRAFNLFLKLYSSLYHKLDKKFPESVFENYAYFCKSILDRPVPPKVPKSPKGLKWVSYELNPGTIVVWKNCLPYRFSAESLTTMICVDLDYFPVDATKDGTYQTDWFTARVNRIMTKHPYSKRVAAMETRTEREVVAFMTKRAPYTSPFVVENEYFNPLPDPLLKVLSGHDFKGNLYLWSDYYKEIRS
jgi:hypothetical protein